MTNGEVMAYCQKLKEVRNGFAVGKRGLRFTKIMFEEFVIESAPLIRKMGWENYKKYISSWENGITNEILTQEQVELIKKHGYETQS